MIVGVNGFSIKKGTIFSQKHTHNLGTQCKLNVTISSSDDLHTVGP